jgi:F-type H+-transporting ATPase subunit epsilon
MQNLINVTIVTPETKFLDSSCYMITIPGGAGYIGVLADHTPIITSLLPNIVHIYSDEKTISHHIFITGGFAEFSENTMVILADDAKNMNDIEEVDVQLTIDNLKKEIESTQDEFHIKKLTEKLSVQDILMELLAKIK